MKKLLSNREFYLYFIQVDNGGAIKIGIAKNPYKRVGELQVGSPDKLNLLYFTPCCREDEQELHKIFTQNYKLHLRGEWFRPDHKIFEYIEEFKRIDRLDHYDWKNHDPEKDLVDMRPNSTRFLRGEGHHGF